MPGQRTRSSVGYVLIFLVLFELFDFNEMNSLSMYEIEYMIHCLLVSCFKMFGIGKKLNQEELSLFTDNYFFQDARINISQLTKWCCQVQLILDFFKIIGQEPPKNTEKVKTSTSLKRSSEDSEFDSPQEDPLMSLTSIGTGQKIIESDDNLLSVEYRNMGKWIINLHNKINNASRRQKEGDEDFPDLKGVSIDLAWTYGFRCTDVANCFSYYVQ